MNTAVHQFDLVGAKEAMCKDLGVVASSSSWRTGVTAECIRLYIHGRRSKAHTSAITSSLRKSILPYFEAVAVGEEGESIDFVDSLDKLAICGDIYREASGYWRPCPIRLVSLPDSDDLLIVGGAPSKYLSKHYGLYPNTFGRARLIEVSREPTSISVEHVIRLRAADWLCLPKPSIKDWTTCELKTAESHMAEGLLEGADDMEVYLPDFDCVKVFRKRWVRLAEALLYCNTPRLARASLYKHGRGAGYFLVKVVRADSREPKILSVQIDKDTGIRLRFGVDACVGNALRASWQDSGTDEFILELHRPWPEAEARVLSFAELLPYAKNDSKREYKFTNRLAPLVKHLLRRLGMRVGSK